MESRIVWKLHELLCHLKSFDLSVNFDQDDSAPVLAEEMFIVLIQHSLDL